MEESKSNKNIWVVLGTIGVLIVLFFTLCFRVVAVGNVGLVTRFGKVVREEQAGVVIKMPWPIEKLQKLNVQVQKEQVDAAASTSDLQDVHTTLALNYHLDGSRVKDIYTQVGTDYKVRIIDPALQEAFKATSAEFTATDLLQKRPLVKEKALEVIRDRLNKHDVIVDDLSIINFKFSPEFTNAIESKQVAQQNAERAKFNLQAAETDSKAQRAQSLTLSKLYLQKQAIEKWDGKLPTYLGGGTVFNIPLK
jgi:prohibitin 1